MAVRKILLRWCCCQLQNIVWDCKSRGSQIELDVKSRISVFLLTLLSGAASAEEIAALVSFGALAAVLALRKLLSCDPQPPQSDADKVQVILDEGAGRRRATGSAKEAALALSGSDIAALMKLGVRVVRGPDWKWGDQVSVDTNRPGFSPVPFAWSFWSSAAPSGPVLVLLAQCWSFWSSAGPSGPVLVLLAQCWFF